MTIDLLEKGAHLHSDWSTISSSYPLITQFILETQIFFFFFFLPRLCSSAEILQLIRDEINELGSPSRLIIAYSRSVFILVYFTSSQ